MGDTLVLMRVTTAARPLLLLLLLPQYTTVGIPVLLQLLLLPRHATVARQVLLQLLLLPRHATVARPVLLQLLLLPRHTTAAHAPPVPKTTTDDKSMGVRWTFWELAENELNNFWFFVPHKLNSLQLRHKQTSLGWIEGQRPLLHHPQGIRNGVTLVQTNLKRSISSRFENVSPYLSVFQDKFLAELAKEVCVVCAADHSNFRSVKGDSVMQGLICYEKLKTLLPGDVFGWKTFYGEFRYNAPRKIRQTLP